MKLVLTSLICIISLNFIGQSVVGKWRTIDDETGKPKSIVEIYKKEGKVFGKIIELINPSEPDPVCDKCEDERKDQKIVGMEIIRDMEQNGKEWEDGTILDPKKGEVYDCKIWVDEDNPNVLNVRGYVLFFFRTQTWERVQ